MPDGGSGFASKKTSKTLQNNKQIDGTRTLKNLRKPHVYWKNGGGRRRLDEVMNKNEIIENAIDLIDVEYVKNAVLSLDARKNKRRVSHKRYYVMAAIAAAILLAIGSAWILHSVRNGDLEPSENASYVPASKETEVMADSSTEPVPTETEGTDSNPETTSAIEETKSTEGPVMSADIKVNRILSEMRSAYPYYSEYSYSYVTEDLKAVSDHFGKNLAGLASLQSYSIVAGYSTEFIFTKDGTLVFDVSHIVYENGSNTVTLSMSRVMKPYDCFYQYDHPQYTDISGVQVLLGENADGTYAVADFETGGISCRVEMSGNLDLEFLVKCIAEMIH